MNPQGWEILSGWLNAWLAADQAGRERLRVQLAVEQPALVAKADALAAASGRLEGFLETPAFVLAAHELAKEDPLLPSDFMVGPYRIVGLLARGGMGDVYRATDTRLRRDVALKVLTQTRTGDRQRVERFMHEARVTASLDHPNVIRVYDVGRFDDRAYLVAELLEGETLRTRIAGGPMSPSDVVQIGIEIGRGLGAAHAAGLVHRDLKPENIFVTRSGTTKLLDFGIAKLAQEDLVRDGFATLTGIVLGTAGYLAPEQIRGARVDSRADLFALGVVLFEMLTGARAFAREHMVETLHAILHEVPSGLLAERDDVPPALKGVVMRLLEKSPDARFKSSADVIAALESVASVAHEQPSRLAASRTQAAGSGASAPATVAVMPFRTIPAGSGNDLLELGLAEVFISRLGQLPEVCVLPLTATERLRGEDPLRAGRQLGANRVLTMTLQRDAGLVRAAVQLLSAVDERTIWSTTVDTDSASIFSIQDIIVTRVIEELAPQLTMQERNRLARPGTLSNSAFEAYLQGRSLVGQPTRVSLTRAAAFFEEAVRLDPEYADAWAGAASAYKRMPVVADGAPAEWFGKARTAATRALEIDPEHPEAHSVLGTVAFWYDWDYPRAEQLLRQAIALQPSSPDAQLFLAHLLSNIGRFDEALVEIRRARALDPAWPVSRSLEGQILFMARRYEAALAHLDAVIDVTRFWNAHLFRAFVSLMLRRYDDAMTDCTQVLDIRSSIDGSARPFSMALAVHGYALARMGRQAEADALLARLRAQSREQYVAPHHEALVLHALGRDEEALCRLRQAVDVRDVYVTFLGVDPKWDRLRGSPEFRDLLARVNLLDVSDRIHR